MDSKDLLNRVLANQSGAEQRRADPQHPDCAGHPDALRSAGKFQNRRGRLRGDHERIRAGGGHYYPQRRYDDPDGRLWSAGLEEQIVQRDENSWLIDGGTPIEDVMRVLDIDEFPQSGNYETIGGFMMFMLRKIPKRTDSVKFSGFKFEVVDIDNYRIDQLLVTRIDSKPTVLVPKLPDAEEKVSA